eukprot:Opistho-2@31762
MQSNETDAPHSALPATPRTSRRLRGDPAEFQPLDRIPRHPILNNPPNMDPPAVANAQAPLLPADPDGLAVEGNAANAPAPLAPVVPPQPAPQAAAPVQMPLPADFAAAVLQVVGAPLQAVNATLAAIQHALAALAPLPGNPLPIDQVGQANPVAAPINPPPPLVIAPPAPAVPVAPLPVYLPGEHGLRLDVRAYTDAIGKFHGDPKKDQHTDIDQFIARLNANTEADFPPATLGTHRLRLLRCLLSGGARDNLNELTQRNPNQMTYDLAVEGLRRIYRPLNRLEDLKDKFAYSTQGSQESLRDFASRKRSEALRITEADARQIITDDDLCMTFLRGMKNQKVASICRNHRNLTEQTRRQHIDRGQPPPVLAVDFDMLSVYATNVEYDFPDLHVVSPSPDTTNATGHTSQKPSRFHAGAQVNSVAPALLAALQTPSHSSAGPSTSGSAVAHMSNKPKDTRRPFGSKSTRNTPSGQEKRGPKNMSATTYNDEARRARYLEFEGCVTCANLDHRADECPHSALGRYVRGNDKGKGPDNSHHDSKN